MGTFDDGRCAVAGVFILYRLARSGESELREYRSAAQMWGREGAEFGFGVANTAVAIVASGSTRGVIIERGVRFERVLESGLGMASTPQRWDVLT